MVQQNALPGSIALSCALQIRMDHHKTAGPSSRQLRSFGVQLTSHVERRELARALIHAFSDRKEAVVRQGQAASGHGSTESRVFQHRLDASWSQIPRRARRRRPRPLSSARQQQAAAGAGPWARGAGRGAPGIWILGTPFLGTPVGVLVSSERPRAFRCHPYPQVWHWGL